VAPIVDTGPLVALLDATDRWPGAFRRVLAPTEMLAKTKLATLDRRRFSAVRPAHTEALTILP
jgi:hypothetical protein